MFTYHSWFHRVIQNLRIIIDCFNQANAGINRCKLCNTHTQCNIYGLEWQHPYIDKWSRICWLSDLTVIFAKKNVYLDQQLPFAGPTTTFNNRCGPISKLNPKLLLNIWHFWLIKMLFKPQSWTLALKFRSDSTNAFLAPTIII